MLHRNVRCSNLCRLRLTRSLLLLPTHKQKLNCALPFQSIRGAWPLDQTRIALRLNKSKLIERSTYVHQLKLEADKLLRLSEVLNIDSLERR